MGISVQFTAKGLVLSNPGSSAVSVELAPGNAMRAANGGVVNPPEGKYWHVNMNTAKGGVTLGGTYGPVNMPGGSSVEFYIDG